MGASLRCGLSHLESTSVPDGGAMIALVTLVDLPDVTAEVMTRVLAAAQRGGPRRPSCSGLQGVPGHPVAIGRAHWPGIRSTATATVVPATTSPTPHQVVECGDLATGRDVDTVDDLHRA